MPLTVRPDLGRMLCERIVAVDTRIVDFAASNFNGDDVCRAVVVHAAGVGIEIDPMNMYFGT
jgi:hypothetical protein